MRQLDRYVLRNFMEPFLICFFGFIAIWLVFDLSDNGPDFIEARASVKDIAGFYLTQLPQTVLISMPVGLLLALLYSLSQMSRRNEIIAMLTAGRSVVRVLTPLIVVGALLTAGCLVLNWQWAPHAEAIKKVALERITKEKKKKGEDREIEGHLFRDRQNNRTWFVQRFKPGSQKLEGVHITQQDAEGNILKKWYAERATFNETARTWALFRGLIVDINKEGDITSTDMFPTNVRVVNDWTETPWRIASSQLDAQNLSVPELREYLKYNGDFPATQLAPYRTNLADRLAFPWSCFVVVFIAAPLGIVYSRRGVLAGVAGSLFIFFVMILLRHLFLALGKGARVDPMVAAWLPNVFFLVVGLLLLYFRSSNREFPKLRLWRA
ncbi:LptF/LptG family permease [Verrucomicrobiota bacterium sgz303538]